MERGKIHHHPSPRRDFASFPNPHLWKGKRSFDRLRMREWAGPNSLSNRSHILSPSKDESHEGAYPPPQSPNPQHPRACRRILSSPAGARLSSSHRRCWRAVVHLFSDAAAVRSSEEVGSPLTGWKPKPAWKVRGRTGDRAFEQARPATPPAPSPPGVKHLPPARPTHNDRGDAGRPAPFRAGNSAPDYTTDVGVPRPQPSIRGQS
jgi:hypothetical protein